jgi:flagellar biosynthesis protein FlhG
MSTILGPDQAEGLRKLMKEIPRTNTKIIAVTSGKGGVGKSSFSLNLGICLSTMKDNPKKVIVFDADLGLANIHILLGFIPKYNLFHVIKGQKKMTEIIYKSDAGVDFIAGASGLSQLANLKDEERENLIEALKDISYADYIIVDTAAGITPNVLTFLASAHEIIVITTPEPTAITDAYGVIKSIVAEVENPDIKLVVNRVKNTTEATRVAKKVIDVCSQFLNVKVENLGFIYEDQIVNESVKKQIPFVQMNPNHNVSICVNHIARRLMNLEVPEEDKGWHKFFKAFFK